MHIGFCREHVPGLLTDRVKWWNTALTVRQECATLLIPVKCMPTAPHSTGAGLRDPSAMQSWVMKGRNISCVQFISCSTLVFSQGEALGSLCIVIVSFLTINLISVSAIQFMKPKESSLVQCPDCFLPSGKIVG